MFPYTRAKSIADQIARQLAPYCERVDIAGSIRREKLEVKDIEIVCRPKKVLTGGKTLFGDEPTTLTNIQGYKECIRSLGKIVKGTTDGRYMQIASYQRINLDIFMPMDYDYFRQLVIRTGSSEYIRNKIAPAWRRLGWVGTEDGLRREEECEPKLITGGTTKWTCVHQKPTLPPVWQSEAEVFAWLKVQGFHPKYRI